jgi:hypothetical protein
MEPDKNIIDISTMNSSDTITINLDNTYGATTTYGVGDIAISDGKISVYTDSNDWITVTGGENNIGVDWDTISNITFDSVLWEDKLPDPETVKKMCEQYPALAKAYENFKTIYSMVEQDWKGNHEDKNGELPF